MNASIKVRKTRDGFSAHSVELAVANPGMVYGEGPTPESAVCNFFAANKRVFGIKSIHFDMTDNVTHSHVTSNGISNTKLA